MHVAKDSLLQEVKLAIEAGDPERVEALLPFVRDVNANVEVDGSRYGTPLEIAIGKGQVDTISVLLRNGANINFLKRHTPLMVACLFHKEMVRHLLQYGADPDTSNAYGLTALHYAAINGNACVVRTLLEFGADVYIRGNNGCTALDELLFTQINPFTSLRARSDLVERLCLLIQAGATPSPGPVGLMKNEESRLLIRIKSLLNRRNAIPYNIYKLVTTAAMTKSLSRMEVAILCRYIETLGDTFLTSIVNFLKRYLKNDLTLKEACRLTIREAIQPPLVMNVLRLAELPKSLIEYIQFR